MSKILVVDDDPNVRDLLADLLALEGHDVYLAGSGSEALDAISRDRPDCLLLDIMMPGMSGHEVLANVRRDDGGPTLPVVMLSAAAEDDQAWRAWTGGVDYFLPKPFDTDYLLQCLDQLAS